jgi:hypothetical protein
MGIMTGKRGKQNPHTNPAQPLNIVAVTISDVLAFSVKFLGLVKQSCEKNAPPAIPNPKHVFNTISKYFFELTVDVSNKRLFDNPNNFNFLVLFTFILIFLY